MPSVAAVVFPFRRLAIWLSVMLLGVAALAVGISALVVVPSLRDNLIRDRVEALRRTSVAQLPSGTVSIDRVTDFATGVTKLTGNQVGVLQLRSSDNQFSQITGTLGGVAEDPLAREALRLGQPVWGPVQVSGRYAAEVAVPTEDRRTVIVFASPLTDVARTVDRVRHDIFLATAIALPVAWLVGALAAFALAERIRRLERAARRIAAGNLSTAVRDDGRDEIHELAQAFDEMRQRLERTDRARREFIANASHELRTPLFALGGFLELLEDEDDAGAQREYITTMRGQVTRLTRLATDLLDLSRLDAGGVELHRDDVDLAGVATMLVSDFVAAAEQRGSTVTLASAAPALALADEGRVGQIGRALVDNALRHTPPGSAITVTTRDDGETVSLLVADDGPAIPAAVGGRLFDRFYRGPGGGEGSGLGLAIARELATRMGGTLTVDQTAGVDGKAFRLTVPAAGSPAVTMLGA
jgi:signal transduction histidine kinase